MRFAFGLVALAGCNQIFGLERAVPLPTGDAAFFDAPIDAPFACPPIGEVPQFSRLFHQVPQRCTEFTASLAADYAIAMCFEPAPTMQIGHGPAGGPLALIAGFETASGKHYDAPRLMPDGDEVIIRDWHESTTVGRFGVYRRNELALTYSHEIKLPNNQATPSFARYGSPSRGPVRRMFWNNNGVMDEIEVAANGTSTLIGKYTEDDLGTTSFAGLPPSMTPDGLRIVYYGASTTSGIFYADRPSLADRFRPVTQLMNVPMSSDAFLTENCERIYFSAIGSVLWVQRL